MLPVILLRGKLGEVGLLSANADDAMAHLGEVSVDAFRTVKVSLTWSCSKSGQGHCTCRDVESSDLDGPLQGADQ